MKNIAVVLPAYNEVQTIASTMEEFHNSLPDTEIWVINNRPNDATEQIAINTLSSLYCKGGVINEQCLGKGNAVRCAFLNIDADIYILADADITYPAALVHELMASVIPDEADVMVSVPGRGMPDKTEKQLEMIAAKPSFLMVGTIEPRKGYLQTIEAFEQLWRDGVDINLVIVGKEGWQGLPDDQRRTMPEIIGKLRDHPELDKHFFWLEGISDEYLEKVYAVSTCLIAASEGEGFGLPLIEAAQHKLPVIARDIPVFHEVAGEYAFYFNGLEPVNLAESIKDWMTLCESGQHPDSQLMPWLTWHQSTAQLLDAII